jgi:hypothetical protein
MRALPLAPRTVPKSPDRALPPARRAAPHSPSPPNFHFETLKRPGDIFLITDLTTTPAFIKTMIPIQDKPEVLQHDNSKQTYNLEAFTTLHVGVIVDTSPGRTTVGGLPLWVVCEAGQGGDIQRCLYDPHVMSLDANGYPLMSGRRLAGWVNIDNYTPWTV